VSRKSGKSRKSSKSEKVSKHHHRSHRSHHREKEEKEEEVDENRSWPRKGKTKISYKLVSKRAIVEKGYPYESDDKLIIIQVALNKEQIDDLIELSEVIRRRDNLDPRESTTEIIRVPSRTNLEIIEETRPRRRSRSRAPDLEIINIGESASDYGERREVLMIDDGRGERPEQEELIRFPDKKIERSKRGRLSWVRPAQH